MKLYVEFIGLVVKSFERHIVAQNHSEQLKKELIDGTSHGHCKQKRFKVHYYPKKCGQVQTSHSESMIVKGYLKLGNCKVILQGIKSTLRSMESSWGCSKELSQRGSVKRISAKNLSIHCSPNFQQKYQFLSKDSFQTASFENTTLSNSMETPSNGVEILFPGNT